MHNIVQDSQVTPSAASDATKSALLQLDNHSDSEIADLVRAGLVPLHHLEYRLTDLNRAVSIRRALLLGDGDWDRLPYTDYNWEQVKGQNAENVVGYMTIPVGLVANLRVNGVDYHVPMCTTEGCLIASTQRGAKAIALGGGAVASVTSRSMTRAPLVKMPDAKSAAALKTWLQDPENYAIIESAFNSTTRFGRLRSVKVALAGRNAYLRFVGECGDAMGMNMVSKGCEKALEVLGMHFPDMRLITIAGNFCTDKKPSAINWIEGRGRSVVVDAVIPQTVVADVLKTTVDAMIEVNYSKNLVGSAMAGSVGGFNAHASNIVTAIFLATGQDPAQNVESSSCMTLMEKTEDGDLYISITMPSIEVGTVGGGTALPAQAACLDVMGLRGSSINPGNNADALASIVASTVMAGELSLIGAQAAGHLVKSHMRLNRKPSANQ